MKAIYYYEFIHWLQIMRLKCDLNDSASVYTENIHLKFIDGSMSHCLRPCDCSVCMNCYSMRAHHLCIHSFVCLFVCLFDWLIDWFIDWLIACLLTYLLACLIFLKKPVSRGKKCNAKCLKWICLLSVT
jgi:hypothetical protein